MRVVFQQGFRCASLCHFKCICVFTVHCPSCPEGSTIFAWSLHRPDFENKPGHWCNEGTACTMHRPDFPNKPRHSCKKVTAGTTVAHLSPQLDWGSWLCLRVSVYASDPTGTNFWCLMLVHVDMFVKTRNSTKSTFIYMYATCMQFVAYTTVYMDQSAGRWPSMSLPSCCPLI